MLRSAAAAARTARAGGRLGPLVALALRQRGRSNRALAAIEGLRARERDLLPGRDGDDLRGVGGVGQDAVRLVAHGHALPAQQDVPVVVLDLLPRSLVDDRLVALPARALLSLAGGHR